MCERVGRTRITSSSCIEDGHTQQQQNQACNATGTIQKDRYRIVVMGAAGVGKTCIINQFLFKQFVSGYKATVEEMYTEDYIINGLDITLDFLDTSGSYEFPAMRKLSISTADAVILVYAVDDEASFDEVKRLRLQVIEQRRDNMAPIVIVGNKTDVADTGRQVRREMAESTANIDWGNGYVEASAKDNVNVSGIFRELLHQAKVRLTHRHSMLRRRDSAPVFSELPSNSTKKKLTKRNSCKIT